MSARWRARLPWLAAIVGAALCCAALATWHVTASAQGEPDAVPWLLVFLSAAGNVALGDAFIRCHRDRRKVVARLAKAAREDRNLLAARDAIITARDAEIDQLNAQVMRLSADNEAPSARGGDRQPRRPVVSQWRPVDDAEAELWRRFEADVCHPAPPGFPERERLDGGEVS